MTPLQSRPHASLSYFPSVPCNQGKMQCVGRPCSAGTPPPPPGAYWPMAMTAALCQAYVGEKTQFMQSCVQINENEA